MEATYHLQQIRDKESVQLSFFDSLKRKKRPQDCDTCGHRVSLLASRRLSKKSQNSRYSGTYQFEVPPPEVDSQESTLSSSTRGGGALGAMLEAASKLEDGRIEFGEVGDLRTSMDYRATMERLNQDNDTSIAEHLGRAQNALMLAWSLATTHSGLWTVEHELVVEHVAENMVKLFSAVLQFRSKRLKELGITMATVLQGTKRTVQKTNPSNSDKKINRRLLLVLNLYKSILQLLRFDALGRHLMVISVRFASSTTQTLLSSKILGVKSAAWQSLYGCYTLLNFSEEALSRVYVSVPSLLPWYNQLPASVQAKCSGVFQNSVLVFLKKLYDGHAVDRGVRKEEVMSNGAANPLARTESVKGSFTSLVEEPVAELCGYAR